MAIDDKDRALFRATVGPVQRLKHGRDRSKPKAPEARPRQRDLDDQAVMDELASGRFDFDSVETGEEISHVKSGLDPRILKQLRKGLWRVQDEIDLHEMTVQVAGSTIKDFLLDAKRAGLSCVKIIHGKGLRSGPDGPKLKRLTAGILAKHRDVMAFASAPSHDGGTGAVHVLLKL